MQTIFHKIHFWRTVLYKHDHMQPYPIQNEKFTVKLTHKLESDQLLCNTALNKTIRPTICQVFSLKAEQSRKKYNILQYKHSWYFLFLTDIRNACFIYL